MRGYGRFMKNVAGLLLLVALVALLLPLCKIPVKEGQISLSGYEFLRASGKVSLEYYEGGKIDDDYVVFAPYTWSDVRSVLEPINEQQKFQLCVVLATLPVVLCGISMLLLFLANGKKCMVLATGCTVLTVLLMLFWMVDFPELHEYFQNGIYIFFALTIIAFVLEILGWITGGFCRPQEKKRQDKDVAKYPKRKKRRKSRKKRKKRKKTGKSERSKEEQKRQENKEDTKECAERYCKAVGKISQGTGIYQSMYRDLSKECRPFLMGTTEDAVKSIMRDDVGAMKRIDSHHCVVQYDAGKEQYTIISHAAEVILLQTEGSEHTELLSMGKKVAVPGRTKLHVANTENTLFLE